MVLGILSVFTNSHIPERSRPVPCEGSAAGAARRLRTGSLIPSSPGPTLLEENTEREREREIEREKKSEMEREREKPLS